MAEMQSIEKSSGGLGSEDKITNMGILRRRSTGDVIRKPASSPVSSEEKVVSRYLRASTSSCHDVCKYGGRHAFESKEKKPVSLLFRQKRSAGKRMDKKDASSGKDRKQKSDAKFVKSAPNLETGFSLKMVCGSSQKDLMENSPVVSDSVQNYSMDNFPVAGCPGDSGDIADKLIATTVLETTDDNEAKQSGSSAPFKSPAQGNGDLRVQKDRSKICAASKPPGAVQSPQKQVWDSKQELPTESAFPHVSRDLGGVADGGTKFKDNEVSETKELKEAELNALSLHSQDRGAAVLKSKKHQAKNPSSPRKRESHSKSLLAPNRKPLATKTSLPPSQSLLASNRKPLAAKAPLSNLSNNSGGIPNGHKKANDATKVKGKREVRSSAPSSFNSPAPRVAHPGSKKHHKNSSPSPSSLVNGGSGLKTTKYLEKKHTVPEKKTGTDVLSTVDVSCTETENKIVNIGDVCASESKKLSPELSPGSVPPSSPLPSSLTSLEEDQESQLTGSTYEDVGTETENAAKISSQEKQMSTRGCGVQIQGKEQMPHKLIFKSGKVIDNQSESDGPRRLKFRQSRVIENKDGTDEIGRRTFRKKRSPSANNGGNAHVGPAVVLRHQDVQAKQDAQDFNQVIEETANKLVKSRKSKVKALVGAFETVISLQETKSVVS
ncbi:uncharacterized protein LOC116259664 [Nymphaea colorata]|uniref:Calmodulin-binding domain-containing protein n=1 Tax=Nymphaea colorata TaxID=210225 RepID=A0A5K1FNY8_9MAGN|nr:uncharacterized protein LOC116259664 [Nymphaea colorata]XP_031493390.1 uncharacterized protein LOC116259664 [Nymphaea colorata]XP_031493391.1 uncharacterized protein LOC116259664 [Nymphaea colorata]XP_031493392.1 uncharacterized protein LOC116259664 [Nymphaea colorata]XP_031493393.1 uncharacterized protein LOC116259664 [Nymphaea colorata]XP_031493394.1 uncharacterized protein LOC116259664 [Nymphaea colorata]XP_049935261.1 uncharacterized protein LOC116259664 [Nymphaea colorata]